MPRIEQRPASTHHGVGDSWGFGVKTFTRPLLIVPAMTHIEHYPKGEHTLDTGLQTLTTVDKVTVSVNVSIILIVEDPILLRNQVPYDEWETVVSVWVRSLVTDNFTGHHFDFAMDKAIGFINEQAFELLRHYGINVLEVVIEDVARTPAFRLFGNTEGGLV